jgi:hypothetical protein
MPSTYSAEPATQLAGQQALRYLETCARQSQTPLLSQIDDPVTAEHRKDGSMTILLHELRSPLAAIQNAMVAHVQ